jgi:hypothetical protein
MFPANGPERIVCSKCGARIRVRRAGAPRPVDEGDGFIRFACPCGRRLKVRIEEEMPASGMCPDCGRVVPIPASRSSSSNLPTNHPESITEELSAGDLANLEQWKQRRQGGRPAPAPAAAVAPNMAVTMPMPASVQEPSEPATTIEQPASSLKTEAGLRVCPRCGKPVHLSSIVCRECGAHVPKR